MSSCQKLGLVTRNQAGNESIAGLEAGKYNIGWKLECRKAIWCWNQVSKQNVQVETNELIDQDNTRHQFPDTSCQVSHTNCQNRSTSMNWNQEPEIKYTVRSHSNHIPKSNRRFAHQTLFSLATESNCQIQSKYILSNSESTDNNPYYCFFRTSANNNSHYCQYYPNRIHTIF